MEGVRRPESVILPENATVPETSLIVPPPNQFSHEVTQAQPYYFTRPQPGAQPAGTFEPGTRVILLVHDGGPYCRVADARGLYVETEYAGLKRI